MYPVKSGIDWFGTYLTSSSESVSIMEASSSLRGAAIFLAAFDDEVNAVNDPDPAADDRAAADGVGLAGFTSSFFDLVFSTVVFFLDFSDFSRNFDTE